MSAERKSNIEEIKPHIEEKNEKEEKIKIVYENIPLCPAWTIPKKGEPPNFTSTQALWLQNAKTLKEIDLLNSYRSHCFYCTDERPIAITLQGYACRGIKFNIRRHSALRSFLLGSEGWNIGIPSSLDRKFDGWPDKCFIKASMRFLVESYLSTKNTKIPECIVREMQILRKLKPSDNMANYVCHWETVGELGQYYLATEYCSCGWEEHGIHKPMSLFGYVTEVLYAGNNSPIREFAKLIHHKKIAYDQCFPASKISAYKRWPTIQGIFRQIVSVVKWLHSRDVAHLDISLENLMISGGKLNQPNIKMIDFGVAQDFSKEKDESKKGKYDICVGKVTYMAPEVREASISKKPYNAYAADIWTIGVCLWIMIYKQYPFHQTARPMDVTQLLEGNHYLRAFLIQEHFLPMITEDAFDVLNQIFKPAEKRITIDELINKPFCR